MSKLIVYIPGISGRTANWKPLIDKLSAEPELRNARWLPIDHHCGWTSKARFDAFAGNVEDRIAAEITRFPEIEEVLIVGHSFGGQLIRKAFMFAAARSDEDPGSPRRWDSRVKRIVLLASINRGIDPARSSRMRLGLFLMRCAYPIFGRTIIFDLLPGSQAVLTLRLAWMRHFAQRANPPMIVQVLGSDDSEVSRDDLADTEQFSNARHLNVPGADHVHLYDLNSTSEPEVHYALIRSAFIDSNPPGAPKPAQPVISRVIFLLHGIRATAHGWPRDLEQAIKASDPNALVVRPSTGYFTALRFAVPLLHRRALRWFQDQYGQLVAKYPSAQFNFVGHSNGTYLMGQSLERVSSITFDRVFLGGCVLPQDFPWPDRFTARQVRQVVNVFTATDSVVGLLCNALRGLGRRDVGTAGYDSFTTVVPDQLTDIPCGGRGHGAAFNSPAKLKRIAAYMLGDSMTGTSEKPKKPCARILVQVAKYAWILLAGLFLAFFWQFGWSFGLMASIATLVIIAFLLAII